MKTNKTISQREARSLKKRVAELEHAENARRNAWVRDYPGGTNIASATAGVELATAIRIARRLRHAVVVTIGDDNTLHYYALPQGKQS